MQTSLEEFEFDVVLQVNKLDEDLANRIFEAECDDALLWENKHVVHLSFERPAGSLGEAVEAALGQLRVAGIAVAQVHAPLDLAHAG